MCTVVHSETGLGKVGRPRPRPLTGQLNAPAYDRRELLLSLISIGMTSALAEQATARPIPLGMLKLHAKLPRQDTLVVADAPPNGTVGVTATPQSGLWVKAPVPDSSDPPAPEFKAWPLPKPSEKYPFPDPFLQRFRGKEVRELMDEFRKSLVGGGYETAGRHALSHYLIPGGFLILTPFENVNSWWEPKWANRWDVDPGHPTGPIDAFFRMFDRYYFARQRQFAFFLSSDSRRSGTSPDSFAKLRLHYEGGRKEFDDRMNHFVINANDQFCAYVYEFEVSKLGERSFVQQSEISGKQHLLRSGITTGGRS